MLQLPKEQEDVRQKLIERLKREKQVYIAKELGVPRQIISAFKHGKKVLYSETLEALQKYLNS